MVGKRRLSGSHHPHYKQEYDDWGGTKKCILNINSKKSEAKISCPKFPYKNSSVKILCQKNILVGGLEGCDGWWSYISYTINYIPVI